MAAPAETILEQSTIAAEVPGTTLLTAQQVAERWQVRTAFVYRLAREGVIPVVALGQRPYYRFRPAAIEAWELEHENGAIAS